jgi:hypothetical protein
MPNDLSFLRQIQTISKNIEDSLYDIDNMLRKHCPEKREVFYQHILPQIVTALKKETKWLARGQYNLEYIIECISNENNDTSLGLKKYLDKSQ